MRLLTLTLATLALVAPVAGANAAPPIQAGILQCQGGQNVGFVVGSVTSLECVFRSEGRRPEPYIAKVQRIGLDLGVTAQTQLSWAVNAPTTRLGRGELAGSYGGPKEMRHEQREGKQTGAGTSASNDVVDPHPSDEEHPYDARRPGGAPVGNRKA